MSTSSFSVLSNCIAASAGTGKTYRLVSRFIALLCLGARPDSLVALTFTNKAAGEFRNRILEALAQGALFVPDAGLPPVKRRNPLAVRVVETLFGAPASAGAAAETVPLLAGADAALLQRAHEAGVFPEDFVELHELLGHALDAPYFCGLLEQLIRQLPQLQLSTLDSFFQKLVSQHCMELGVGDVSPLMGDEEERARKEALHAMIQLHDTSEELRRGFIDMCLSVTKGNPKGLEEKLADYVKRYGTLTERYPEESAWRRFSDFDLEDLTDTPPMSADEWATIREEYAEALAAAAPDFKPNSRPDQSTRGFLAKMEEGNFGGMRYLDDYLVSDKFCGAAHERLRELIVRIRERCRAELLRTTELKSLGVYRLLRAYAECYRRSVQSTGRMTFRDMTKEAQTLFGMQATEEESCRYDHWMLDEFQDTDRVQWDALRGLLDEVVTESELAGEAEHAGRTFRSSARSLFVVGDSKQGIYGFRGTDGTLFSMLHNPDAPAQKPGDELYHEVLVPSSLSLSYRSARAVMGADGFVNTLFRSIGENEKAVEGVSLDSFTHHDTVHRTRGYVRVELLEKTAEADTLREHIMPQAIVRILKEELTTDACDALRPGLTAAVLVRSNTEAKAIVQYLHRHLPHLPVQLVGDKEVAAASALGEVLFSLFLWLQHPADAYRLGVLRLSPLVPLTEHAEGRDAAHTALLRALDARGYAALLRERVIPLFPDYAGARTFDEWLAAATEFDLAGGTLTEWVDFMRQRCSRDAASSRAVQVMTMHKSKGLEFDAVIVPYIGENAMDDTSDLAFFTTPEAVMVSPGGEGQRAAFPESAWARLTEEWKERQRREAYNLMYVATTRAKQACYVLLRSVGKVTERAKSPSYVEVKSASAAGVIARALLGGDKFEQGSVEFDVLSTDGVLYEQGYRDWRVDTVIVGAVSVAESGGNIEEWFAELGGMGAERSAENGASPFRLLPPSPRRRKVTPSHIGEEALSPVLPDENRPRAAASAPLYGLERSAAEFGTAVHELFERIEWLTQAPETLFAGHDSPETAVVRAALSVPAVADLFRQQSGQEVYNEQDMDALWSLDGEEVWVSGTIDRLVLTRDADGRVIEAHIIDFKTDLRDDTLPPEEQDAALCNRHRAQMQSYTKLVAAAFSLNEGAVHVTLISVPSNGADARAVVCAC